MIEDLIDQAFYKKGSILIPNQSLREEGYYWVKWQHSDEPEVGFWSSGGWWTNNIEGSMKDEEYVVLSERLTPPK